MALNIDTIRSLDANKTYYLANSTGQIKEAGAWQRFKCYFGIGDALAVRAALAEPAAAPSPASGAGFSGGKGTGNFISV